MSRLRGEDAGARGPERITSRAVGEAQRGGGGSTVYEAAEARGWDDIRAEAEPARAVFLEAVDTAPQALLEAGDGLGAYIVGGNGSFHYEEHMADFAPRD